MSTFLKLLINKRNIKKNIIIVVFIICLCFMLIYVLSYIPKPINKIYEGIEFRIGEDNPIRNVNIEIRGKLFRPIFSHHRFKGSIYIDYFPESKDAEVELILTNKTYKGYPLHYSGLKLINSKYKMWHYPFGTFYTDSEFNNIVIHCYETANNKDNRIISAPSKTITEGIEVLMEMNLLEYFNLYFN